MIDVTGLSYTYRGAALPAPFTAPPCDLRRKQGVRIRGGENSERDWYRSGGRVFVDEPLQALLSKDSVASVILSASVWCEVDQAATLDALAKQVERSLAVAEIKAPDGVLAAIRAAQQTKVSADGLSFDVLPISVDPDACSRVPADELGAVLMKVDVSVKG